MKQIKTSLFAFAIFSSVLTTAACTDTNIQNANTNEQTADVMADKSTSTVEVKTNQTEPTAPSTSPSKEASTINDDLSTTYTTESGIKISVRYDKADKVEAAHVTVGDKTKAYYYVDNAQLSYGLYKTKNGQETFVDKGDEVQVDDDNAPDGVYIGYLNALVE